MYNCGGIGTSIQQPHAACSKYMCTGLHRLFTTHVFHYHRYTTVDTHTTHRRREREVTRQINTVTFREDRSKRQCPCNPEDLIRGDDMCMKNHI